MTQADGAAAAAGSSASSGGQQLTPTTETRKASNEAIAAAATAVVAEAITIAHGEAGRKGALDATTKDNELATSSATATPKVEGQASAAAPGDDAEDGGSGGALTDRQLGASPRPMKPGGDLRASFLAAVGNTISQTVRTCGR